MRYLVIVTWAAIPAVAVSSENDLWRSDSVLQARQFDSHRHSPRAVSFQNRSHLNPKLESYILQRRADHQRRSDSGSSSRSSSRSSESPPRLPSPGPHRSSSPGSNVARASIRAKGPATINTTGTHGTQHKNVPGGWRQHLEDQHAHYAVASGRSYGLIPYGQKLTASAKGQTVMAQVIPSPGTRGLVRFVHHNGALTNIPITNQDGRFHTSSNFAAGETEVIASTKHGGHVQAFAINNQNTQTGQQPNQRGQ